jgi:thiamine pyrophosphokinase
MEEARPQAGAVVVAADSGLLLAEAAGLRPDWIIGDMDSLAPDRLAPYPPEKILRYPPDKDFTDTELALTLLREKGCGPVWIIGGGGGRLDQLFAIRSLFEREYPPERWITGGEDIHCLQAPLSKTPLCEMMLPSTLDISLDRTPLVPVSVFPLGDGPWEAESSGLRWPLAGLSWNRGFFGISNEAPDGNFTVKALRGRFMVMSPINPNVSLTVAYT